MGEDCKLQQKYILHVDNLWFQKISISTHRYWEQVLYSYMSFSQTVFLNVIHETGGPYREKLCPRCQVWPKAVPEVSSTALGQRPRAVLETSDTVFPYTDQPRLVNNIFFFPTFPFGNLIFTDCLTKPLV